MRSPRAPWTCPALAGLALVLAGVGCRPHRTSDPTIDPTEASERPDERPDDARAPQPHPLDAAVRIFDAEGHEHDMASLLDALAEHRVVLLGETHLDDVTHQVELAVLEGLAARRQDRVVLSLEMFERDVQPVLDRYLAGELDEAAMLEQARPWGNYRTDYRPLVEAARARDLPVRAANAPGPTMMQATQGPEAYAQVRAEHPAWLPEQVFPARDAYWARVDRTIRGHGPGRGGDRTYSVQNLWDNAMADTVVEATRAWPEHQVLHVAGGFHVEHHDGTVAQIRRRDPELDLVTVTVVPTFDRVRVGPDPERADFVVYADHYAEGPSGGQLSVATPGSLTYRLHLPEGPAPEGGWPLLLWLADDEQRPDDALLRLRMTAGQEAAVVVVEPPYPTRAREGWMVQRWAWPSSWSDDLSVAAIGLRRIAEYARRRLPIRSRVVVAGEGAGATVALWAAQYGQEWSGVHVVAIDPQWPRALRSAAIPDDPSTIDGLELYGAPQDADLEGLRGVGLTPRIEPPPPPGGARDALVRRALGLAEERPRTDPPVHPDPAAPMASPDHPLELTLDQPSPLSTSWAALYAALLVSRGHDARVRLAGAPATPGARPLVFDGRSAAHDALLLDVFAEGKGLPKTPDFFAGAVVLLVPASARPRVATRWAEVLGQVEASQGFIKTPYRAVREGDAAALTRTLSELRDRGRTEVLVVPVELCATGARMQRYLDAVEPRAEGLTLHWLPGLGHHVVQHLHAAEP